jgi:hypothetical protein
MGAARAGRTSGIETREWVLLIFEFKYSPTYRGACSDESIRPASGTLRDRTDLATSCQGGVLCFRLFCDGDGERGLEREGM